MQNIQRTVKQSLRSGVKKGLSGFIWMLKILIPISFLTALLEYSGWLYKIDFLLKPGMNLLDLPPVAALPLIAGMLTGIYGCIAAMAMLPLTIVQMTLIANFVLISHNLIQEGVIQGKSGLNPVRATLLRLTASIVTVTAISFFIKPDSAAPAPIGASVAVHPPMLIMLKSWFVAMLYLSFKIFVIIMVLMIILETMKSFNLIPHLVKILTPLLKTMGLDQRVGILWLTATVFGVAYGGAVIVEEAKEGNLTVRELERLHFSIGINHSMVEDPALFLPLGLSAFWLWVPRLITAIMAVHL
ncbi:MAG: iron transporter, partial [Deltaproteobacteria bacterium]|nr:iron transporter [Deltaproteobacteria bacterium]